MFSVSALGRLYRYPIIGHLAQRMVLRRGADIPRSVKIGHRVSFPHNALGTVLHPDTTLEDYVKVYQNVTIGRGNIWLDYHAESRLRFTVKMGAILCAGCKIICSEDELVVGKNTVIAANAVLTRSTGDNEIWAGIPARKIRDLGVGSEQTTIINSPSGKTFEID